MFRRILCHVSSSNSEFGDIVALTKLVFLLELVRWFCLNISCRLWLSEVRGMLEEFHVVI